MSKVFAIGCRFLGHDYVFREPGLDPRNPDATAALLDVVSSTLAGIIGPRRWVIRACRRCGSADRNDDLLYFADPNDLQNPMKLDPTLGSFSSEESSVLRLIRNPVKGYTFE
jgi:hypothetical protein